MSTTATISSTINQSRISTKPSTALSAVSSTHKSTTGSIIQENMNLGLNGLSYNTALGYDCFKRRMISRNIFQVLYVDQFAAIMDL